MHAPASQDDAAKAQAHQFLRSLLGQTTDVSELKTVLSPAALMTIANHLCGVFPEAVVPQGWFLTNNCVCLRFLVDYKQVRSRQVTSLGMLFASSCAFVWLWVSQGHAFQGRTIHLQFIERVVFTEYAHGKSRR